MTDGQTTINGKAYLLRKRNPGEDPLYVDPSTVVCGFLTFPRELASLFGSEQVHEALQTNKTELWKAVRRARPSVPVRLVAHDDSFGATDPGAALVLHADYPGQSFAFDVMQVLLDRGRRANIFAGIVYPWEPPEIVIAGPQMILPGRRLAAPAAVAGAGSLAKRWWQVWR